MGINPKGRKLRNATKISGVSRETSPMAKKKKKVVKKKKGGAKKKKRV